MNYRIPDLLRVKKRGQWIDLPHINVDDAVREFRTQGEAILNYAGTIGYRNLNAQHIYTDNASRFRIGSVCLCDADRLTVLESVRESLAAFREDQTALDLHLFYDIRNASAPQIRYTLLMPFRAPSDEWNSAWLTIEYDGRGPYVRDVLTPQMAEEDRRTARKNLALALCYYERFGSELQMAKGRRLKQLFAPDLEALS